MQVGDKVEIKDGTFTGVKATILGAMPGNQFRVRFENSEREMVVGGQDLRAVIVDTD